MKRFLFSFAYWLQYLTLAVWVGSAIAVPVFAIKIFAHLDEDRLNAARIVGSSLNLLGGVQMACGLVLILAVTALLLFVPSSGSGSRWRIFQAIKIILPILMLLTTTFLIRSTGPRMESLRENAAKVNYEDWSGPEKAEFDTLHKQYTAFSKGILLGGILLFLIFAVDSSDHMILRASSPMNESRQTDDISKIKTGTDEA